MGSLVECMIILSSFVGLDVKWTTIFLVMGKYVPCGQLQVWVAQVEGVKGGSKVVGGGQ